jgi:hypothetical protein
MGNAVEGGQRLAYVTTEGGADSRKSAIQCGCHGLGAHYPSEPEQSYNEGVFHHVLTFFAAGQILKFDVELEK